MSSYYLPGPFKAKFCRDSDSVIRMLAKKKGILVRNMWKVVMARNYEENISFTCSNWSSRIQRKTMAMLRNKGKGR